MATEPKWNPRRGTYQVQWWNGVKWVRTTVTRRPSGWKPGNPEPKKKPPEAFAAMAELQKKEDAARAAPVRSVDQPLKTFLEGYASRYQRERAEGSHGQLVMAIDGFLEWCDKRGVRMVAAVTPEVCDAWVQARLSMQSAKTKGKIERVTVKKERALLSGAWRAAVKIDALPSNPWARIEVGGKTTTREKKSWSPDQYRSLLAECRPWLRDLIIVGCHCGLRIEALMGLEWRDVRLPRSDREGFGFIVVRPELDKIGRGYEVPIVDELHTILCRRRLHHRDDAHSRVLLGHAGRPLLRSNQTYKAIVSACERAGLEKPASPNHHMRRTFGRWAVFGYLTGRPVPMYVVSQWMGHTSVDMTEKYLAITINDSVRWAERVQPTDANASEGQEPVST